MLPVQFVLNTTPDDGKFCQIRLIPKFVNVTRATNPYNCRNYRMITSTKRWEIQLESRNAVPFYSKSLLSRDYVQYRRSYGASYSFL